MAAIRTWMLMTAALISLDGAAAQAQVVQAHSQLIPLPHPEILYPNESNLTPGAAEHPRVDGATSHYLARNQGLIPLPHPELVHPQAASVP